MTIAAGLLCPDGIVLCPDTEHTGMTKQAGPKLWVTTTPATDNGLCLALAGAGESLLLREIRDRLKRAVVSGVSCGEAIEKIREALLLFYQQNIYVHPDAGNRTLQILVAIRDETGCQLFQNSDHSLGPVDASACVGHGTELGEFLLGSSMAGFAGSLNAAIARCLAIYTLMQVKKYSPYCGGASQVLVIPQQGQPMFVDDAEVVAFEKSFANSLLHPGLSAVAFGVVMSDATSLTFEDLRKAMEIWGRSQRPKPTPSE